MKKALFLSLFIALVGLTHANGDPVIEASALIASSSPTPRKIVDIQLVREDLLIEPGNYTYVTVKYELHNKSSKDYDDIDYAFPVDYMGGDKYLNSDLISDIYSGTKFVLGWKDKYIKEIHFTMNGKSLESKVSDEVKIGGPSEEPKLDDWKDFEDLTEEQNEFEYEGALQIYDTEQIYRKWFYTKFSIKSGETAILEVRYALYNNRSRAAYGGRLGPYGGSNCSLQYDMSPAQNWGNGKVGSFNAKIDASGLSSEPSFFEPSKEKYQSSNVSIEGLPFKRNEGIYTYQAKNFNFKTCEPLSIQYYLQNDEEPATIREHIISPDRYTITATDEVTQYPVENLSDMDLSTAWVTTKENGMGQKLTIKFHTPTKLRYVVLVNGYHKSKTSYEQNNRVKRLECEYKTEDSDSNGSYDVKTKVQNYKVLDEINFRNHPDVLAIDLNHSDQTILEIELKIQDVHHGSKYNDTCISEIVLLENF